MKVAYDPKIPYFSIDVECVATGSHARECVLCALVPSCACSCVCVCVCAGVLVCVRARVAM